MKKQLLFAVLLISNTVAAQIPSNPVREYLFTNSAFANTAPTGSSGDLIINTGNGNTFVDDRSNNSVSALSVGNTEFFGGAITANNANPLNEIGISFWYKFDENLAAGTTENILRLTAGGTNTFTVRRTGNDVIEHRLVAGNETSVGTIQDPVLQSSANFVHIYLNIILDTNQRVVDAYLNGSIVGSTTNSNVSTDLFSSNVFLNLGVISNGVGLEGILDDIRIYDRSLTTSEIQQLSSEGLSTCTTFVNIPDANFKAALLEHGTDITGNNISVIDTDGDNEICITEAQAYTGAIVVTNLNINNLTGIEAFVNATQIDCADNNISSLDVSSNIALTDLYCSDNQITNLDVTANTAITTLDCENNQLTSFDVSQNSNLRFLFVSDNQISSLDVSSNSNLEWLYALRNQLISLNVANGNNSGFGAQGLQIMNANLNPNLACIQHDTGFDPTTNGNWNKDTSAIWSDNCSANSCTTIVSIPDANFKAALIGNPAINTDGDNEICINEATAYTAQINVNNLNISDLTGIEAFTNITGLRFNGNNVSSLDLMMNTDLTIIQGNNNLLSNIQLPVLPNLINLSLRDNNLNSLNVSSFTSLSNLDLEDNNFSQLDVSNLSQLQNLKVTRNQLQQLDLTNNDALFEFNALDNALTSLSLPTNNTTLRAIVVSQNNLTSLDVSAFSALRDLNFDNNNINNINLTNNPAIRILTASNNNLTTLDVTGKPDLLILEFNNNQIQNIDVSGSPLLNTIRGNNNSLSELNIANGNNSNIPTFGWDVTNNPNLNCIEVSDVAYAQSNWTNTDAGVTFSTNCPSTSCTTIINILDSNFKAALLDHGVGITGAGIGVIDTDGDGEICTTEAQSYTGTIDVSSQSISDVTGIEAFTSLTQLFCNNNNLNSLDITTNTALTELVCDSNQLTALDVSQNNALEVLRCAVNQIGSLDVSNNINLTVLICGGNLLNNLDVSENTDLTNLVCSFNNLSDLDISDNTALTSLTVNNNQLTSLNVANGNNTNVTFMDGRFNPNLNCIQHDTGYDPITNINWQKDASTIWSDNCAASTCTTFVNIPDANFKAILVGDPSINTDGDSEICITEAQAYTGAIFVVMQGISDLTGIEAFTNITELACDENQLTSLDISSNTALTILTCGLNQLTSLDVSNNTLLTEINCGGNQLNSLDVSNNTALIGLFCGANQLNSLDISANTNLEQLNCVDNQLTSLNVANTNNSNMTLMAASMNSSLSCIQHDSGFDPTSNSNWVKDASAIWSDNCNAGSCSTIVNIPDANFKAFLVADTAINTNGDSEIQCSEAQAVTGPLFPASQNISDLTGVEAFINIDRLNATNNNLTSVDLSQNILLEILELGQNNLTSLDLSQNTALITVNSGINDLTNIVLPTGNSLRFLDLQANDLTTIDLSVAPSLENINLRVNQLNTLDVSTLLNLQDLRISQNPIASLDVTNNSALESLIVDDTSITALDLMNLQNLDRINVSFTELSEIDLSANINLSRVDAFDIPTLTLFNIANGNNSNIPSNAFFVQQTPNLSCIQVSDLNYAQANWSNSVDSGVIFSTNCSLSLIDLDLQERITIYPNPVKTTLEILTEGVEIKRAIIYSSLGKKLINTDNTTIDVNNLAKGLYILRLETIDNSFYTKKFIKK